MQYYDFTKETWHNIIKPAPSGMLYCNDNMDVEQKQKAIQAVEDWFVAVEELLTADNKRKIYGLRVVK